MLNLTRRVFIALLLGSLLLLGLASPIPAATAERTTHLTILRPPHNRPAAAARMVPVSPLKMPWAMTIGRKRIPPSA